MAENSNLTTIEKRFTALQNAERREWIPSSKIQKVAHYLRDRKHFAKHYSPKLVSIGPIHHGSPKLQLGEEYKLMWASMYINKTTQTPQTLHEKIACNIKELKDLFSRDVFTMDQFTEDSIRNRGFNNLDEMLTWILFVDGCCLLHILEKAKLDDPREMNVKLDQLVLAMQDVLLLENQLPYKVLKLLWKYEEAKLIDTMINFLHCHHWFPVNNANQKHQRRTPQQESKVVLFILQDDESPTHLLDLQRRMILRPKEGEEDKKNHHHHHHQKQNNDSEEKNDMITHRNIQELKAAGITLKACKSRSPRDISFSCGWLEAELQLPEIVVDDTTAVTVLNLIAYEMCPDFENDYDICSYVAFLDSLIDHPEDVKALRSEGILLNSLGNDEEVAKLFNTISTDLVHDSEKYSNVKFQIEKHYRNKWKTWIALACHTYFSNPWSIITFIAAVVALALTSIQTWYAINPAKS